MPELNRRHEAAARRAAGRLCLVPDAREQTAEPRMTGTTRGGNKSLTKLWATPTSDHLHQSDQLCDMHNDLWGEWGAAQGKGNKRGLLEVCMVTGHVCHGGFCKELGNVPAVAHIVHHSLVTKQLQQVRIQ